MIVNELGIAFPHLPDLTLHSLPNQILSLRYDRLFHFFFSKTIKKLVQKDDCPQLQELKQFEYLDDDRQMMKRSYDTEEFQDRIGILVEISYPETKFNFHFIQPLVVGNMERKIMEKRTKRLKKYEEKLQEIEEEVPVQFQSKFLSSVDSRTEGEEMSYSTDCHDIFDVRVGEGEAEGEGDKKGGDFDKMVRVCTRGLSVLGQANQLISDLPQHLTLDFDDINQEEVLSSYKKLTSKTSFKKKYPPQPQPHPTFPQDPTRPSFKKKTDETTRLLSNHLKIEPYNISAITKPQLSPKLYNSNRIHNDKFPSKRITYMEPSDQSLESANEPKRNGHRTNTVLDLNHASLLRKQMEMSSNPSSVRSPTTSNTTEFKAIRKRALELLSEDSTNLNSPKFAKAKSPATFTIQRH